MTNSILPTLSGLMFCVSGQFSHAQEAPSYDISNLDVDVVTTWESSEGLLEGQSLGFNGTHYVYEVEKQLLSGEIEVVRLGVTKESRLVWQQFLGNRPAQYFFDPHDCSFVVGECKADLYIDGIEIANMLDIATYHNGVWIHKEVMSFIGGETLTTTYCGIYDAQSITIASYVSDDSGQLYWERITSGPYAAQSAAALERVKRVCGAAFPVS